MAELRVWWIVMSSNMWVDSVGNPHDANDHVHALGLTALVLVVPDAVLFSVPVSTGCRVHTATTNGASGCGGCGVGAGRTRIGQMLDDCRVDGELVLDFALCFGDERVQDVFLVGQRKKVVR
jgi:hypothetical protein